MDLAEKVQSYLAPLLGQNTARIAVKPLRKKLGKDLTI